MAREDVAAGRNSHSRSDAVSSWIRFLAFAVPLTLAFVQYVESTLLSKVDRVDRAFSEAVDGLSSRSAAVEAQALRSIADVAFERSPNEPRFGFTGFFANMGIWFAGMSERRALERGRNLLRDYVQTDRAYASARDAQLVSTTLGEIIVDWLATEAAIGSRPEDYQFLFVNAQLPHAELPRKDMSSLYLTGANLAGADLSYADLRSTSLDEANLTGAILDSANLTSARFIGARGGGARFRFASAAGAQIVRADMPRADFGAANLSHADFASSNLAGSQFGHADLRDANFRNADLSGADFSGADLAFAQFAGADLSGADLRLVRNFKDIRSFDGAVLDGALLPAAPPPMNQR